MSDEEVNLIFSCLCSCCGENSGGLGFLAVNENGEETPVMICWKRLAKKAAEAKKKMDGDVNDA